MKTTGRDAKTEKQDDLNEIPSRRSFLKLGAAAIAAPALLSSAAALAEDGEDDDVSAPVIPPSPATIPWVERLPDAITPLQTIEHLLPDHKVQADVANGECGRDDHQRYDELCPTEPVMYELHAIQRNWVFNPALPAQPVWNYQTKAEADRTADGAPLASLSTVIRARYGAPVMLRMHNDLPQEHQGFGTPEISTHLHNLHCPSESDGFPSDYYSGDKSGPTLSGPGSYKDHFYPNVCAGYDEVNSDPALAPYAARDAQGKMIGDHREALGTLFFHDHCLDFTAANVVRGLTGFYLLYDELDSGDERDTNPKALRLPSGAYDYPLNFCDRRFDLSGKLYYDQLNPEGVLGDKTLINGKIEPVLNVAARKYRLRLLNSGPSRFYAFYLVNSSNAVQPFTYIANDGNLLPAPLLNQTKVQLGVAERADIIVDFGKYPAGTELYLVNRLRQEDTRGPKDIRTPGTRVLKLVVGNKVADYSRIPAKLRELRPITAAELNNAKVRRWEFGRKGGLWTVNDKIFDVQQVSAKIEKGSCEIWELDSPSGGWSHPVHIHFEEGRILSKVVDGKSVPVPPHEQGRKDVFALGESSSMRVFLRFRDFAGKYVMHCHNMIHEDHMMMVRFDIEDDDDDGSSGSV
ncbi:bilirubin oxidase [Pseudomonas cavernae]|uniref:Bilirubin oxidase n=1 Tax=Pseudomonas cavernae TaxID=2320867 RepID=A0A385YWA4_9PSED|nr:multicopper oxidase domain-containing protein [Pseudomonas cavernae]AYC31195.1 bilirubin oxidase [Pseudomonas cavernae]